MENIYVILKPWFEIFTPHPFCRVDVSLRLWEYNCCTNTSCFLSLSKCNLVWIILDEYYEQRETAFKIFHLQKLIWTVMALIWVSKRTFLCRDYYWLMNHCAHIKLLYRSMFATFYISCALILSMCAKCLWYCLLIKYELFFISSLDSLYLFYNNKLPWIIWYLPLVWSLLFF